MFGCDFSKAICEISRSAGVFFRGGWGESDAFDTFSDPILNQSDDFGTLCSRIQNLGPGTKTLHQDASDGAISIVNEYFFDIRSNECD